MTGPSTLRAIGPRIRATLTALLIGALGLMAIGWIGSGPALRTATASERAATPAPAVPGVDAFFGRIIGAMVRGDATAYGQCFDADLMLSHVLDAASIEPRSPRRRRQMAAAFAASLGQTVHQYRDGLAWTDYDVHRVERPARNELVVTIRATNQLGLAVKSRWWLARHDDGWIAFDVEDLDLGYRVSAAMGTIVAAAGGGPKPWFEDVRRLNSVPALLVSGEIAEAEVILTGMADSGLPAPFEAMRLMLLASVRAGMDRYAEAERDIEAAAALNPDMPILDYLRASVRNGLGRHDAALEAARRYADGVGGDAETSLEIGRALLGLGRHAEATAAWREGLAYSADCVDCLYELIGVLGPEGCTELGALLPSMTGPRDTADILAGAFLAEGQLKAAESVLDTYTAFAPDDRSLVIHLADLRMRQQRHEEAADLLRAEIDGGADDESLRIVLVEALLGAGDPMQAYREGGATSDVFAHVGEELVWREEPALLDELIEVHLQTHPRDQWIAWFVGRRHEMAGEHAEAARVFHAGLLRSAGDEMSHLYRGALIAARFESGAAMETLASIPPWRDTARQIADMCVAANDVPRLRELVKTCAANPDSTDLAHLFSAEARFHEGDHQATVAILLEHADPITADPQSIACFDDRLVRSLLRLGRHDEALDAARMSTARDTDPYYEVLVHAAAGRVEDATKVFDRCLFLGYEPEAFFADPDGGPVLKTSQFADLTERFPWVTQAEDDRPE